VRVLVAPDKFKGSLTAGAAGDAIAAGLRLAQPRLEVLLAPVADGGDGTVDAAVAAGFQRVTTTVTGPIGQPVVSGYALREETAVIELAEASGLRRLPNGRTAPLTATTFGTGELIRAALERGARRVVVGVGGSATSDGGVGMAQALGVRFLNRRLGCYPVFVHDGNGYEQLIDPKDYTNLDTRLDPGGRRSHRQPSPGQPEAMLEARIRADIESLDATFHPHPVYGQVTEFAGGDRGIIDLLAADRDGRLAVIELKVDQDIHLPLQALDYWMRVRWHLERGEFTERGYFSGIALRQDPPRLLLVAPALEFHPANEVVLGFFSPDIPVERVGLGIQWKRELKVMFRAPSRFQQSVLS